MSIGNPVLNPSYYRREGLELQFVVAQWGLGYLLGNIVKYTCRAGHKGPAAVDIAKALRIADMCFPIFEAGIALAWPVLPLRDISPAMIVDAWALTHNRAQVISLLHSFAHYEHPRPTPRRAELVQIRFYLENELTLIQAEERQDATDDQQGARHA